MPAGSTYSTIATSTLSTSATDVTFSSISQIYTDLILVIDGISSTAAGAGVSMQFNGDTGSNYWFTYMLGNGSSTSSGRQGNTFLNLGNINASRSVNRFNIQNYSNTTTFKSMIGRASLANQYDVTYVGLWKSTSAITSIKVTIESGTYSFNSGSTFTLYGIASA